MIMIRDSRLYLLIVLIINISILIEVELILGVLILWWVWKDKV